MSEEAEADKDKVVEPEVKQSHDDIEEDTARQSGWKPEGEWDEDDPHKPHKFTSAETFNARRELIKEIKTQKKRVDAMESQFNTRLDNSNKLHKATLEAQKADLIDKRDAAIDLADREAANKHQESIDNLHVPEEVPAVNAAQATLDNWNSNNAWIFQGGPKAAYAQAQMNQYLGAGQDVNAAISNMEADITREFPAINPNRENHPRSEGGSKPGGKRGSRAVTMADLTDEERNIYKKTPGTWATEAEFLKAVQDSRS